MQTPRIVLLETFDIMDTSSSAIGGGSRYHVGESLREYFIDTTINTSGAPIIH